MNPFEDAYDVYIGVNYGETVHEQDRTIAPAASMVSSTTNPFDDDDVEDDTEDDKDRPAYVNNPSDDEYDDIHEDSNEVNAQPLDNVDPSSAMKSPSNPFAEDEDGDNEEEVEEHEEDAVSDDREEKKLVIEKEVEEETSTYESNLVDYGRQRKLQVQLCALERTLKHIDDVDLEQIPWEWSAGKPDASLKIEPAALDLLVLSRISDKNDIDRPISYITKKTIAIEADRRRLLEENQRMKATNQSQIDKIAVLMDKIKFLEQTQWDIRETNLRLRDQLEHKDNKIAALEELFANINTNRHFNFGIGNLVDNMDDYSLEADDEDAVSGFEDVDLDSMKATDAIELQLDSIEHEQTHQKSGRKQQRKSLSSRSEAEVQDESMEIVLLADRLEMEQRNHETAKNLVECLQAKLDQQKMDVMAAQTKAEHRATLLQDVINQYKELQVDHEDALEELQVLKNRVESFKEYHHTLELELKQYRRKNRSKSLSSSKLQEAHGDDRVLEDSDPTKVEVESEQASEVPLEDDTSVALTADITEASSSYHATVNNHSEDVSATGAFKNMATTIEQLTHYKARAEKEIKSLEKDCDRLQHEFDTAIHKILELENELSDSQDELMKATLKIGELEGEISQIKQERQDGDVKEVQQHLSGQRCDIEKEYRKLQHDLEGAKRSAEELEEKLAKAKADLDSSREESESARKLLTDCNVKHEQLKQQYQDLKDEKKALKISLRKETAERKGLEQLKLLPEKVDELVAQYTKAEEELRHLKLENADLKQYCNDFLQLASKSVEAMQ